MAFCRMVSLCKRLVRAPVACVSSCNERQFLNRRIGKREGIQIIQPHSPINEFIT